MRATYLEKLLRQYIWCVLNVDHISLLLFQYNDSIDDLINCFVKLSEGVIQREGRK
jgi:hypothetical protein